MQFVKGLAVLWGLVYLVLGWLEAFNWNGNDGIISTVLLLAIFVLPFPTTLAGFWFSRTAGKLLLLYSLLTLIFAVIATWGAHTSFTNATLDNAEIEALCLPHLVFGFIYTRAERKVKLSSRISAGL